MDKTTLVSTDISDGKKLLQTLDRSTFKVSSALWFYFKEFDEWRLVLASKYVDKHGPKKAYTFIQKKLENMEPPLGIKLSDISLVGPDSDSINKLRVAVKTGPKDIADMRITHTVVDNTMIEDVHIYRMTPRHKDDFAYFYLTNE